jgi:hypothetical protein
MAAEMVNTVLATVRARELAIAEYALFGILHSDCNMNASRKVRELHCQW